MVVRVAQLETVAPVAPEVMVVLGRIPVPLAAPAVAMVEPEVTVVLAATAVAVAADHLLLWYWWTQRLLWRTSLCNLEMAAMAEAPEMAGPEMVGIPTPFSHPIRDSFQI